MKTELASSPITQAWESLRADRLLSVRTISEEFGVTPYTIRRWLHEKKLRGCKVGGQIRIRQSQVLGLMRELETGESLAKTV